MQTIVAFVRDHQSWAAPMAFLVAFMESFCFLSIVWPGTAILIAISGLLAAGDSLDVLLPSIIAAGIGGTLGYAVSYWIGLYYKEEIKTIWPFRNNLAILERGQAFFDKWGAIGVFLGHFLVRCARLSRSLPACMQSRNGSSRSPTSRRRSSGQPA